MTSIAKVKKGPCIGQRHIIAILLHLGQTIQYTIRVALTIVLVALVGEQTSQKVVQSECGANINESLSDSTNETATASITPTTGEVFEWSRELQGLILSSFYWGYLVLQIPAGNWAQRYGSKWLFGVGVLLTSLLNFVAPISARTSPYLLVTLLFLKGVISGITAPAQMAMLGRWTPPQETSGLVTIAISGVYSGTIAGQLSTGPICESYALGGWPTVFYLNGCLGTAWFVIWSIVAADSPEEHPWITVEERDYITSSAGVDQRAANRVGIPWRKILLSREMAIYVPALFSLGWISYSMLICMPQYISDVLHADISADGYLSSLPVFSEFLVSNILTQLADWMIRSRFMPKIKVKKLFTLIGFWGCAVGFVLLNLVGCNLAVTVPLLAVGLAQLGGVYAGVFTMPMDVCPEFAGTMYGIGNTASTLAGMSAPIVTDMMTAGNKTLTAWNRVFYLSIGMAIGSGLLHLLFGSAERRWWHKENEKDPLLKSSSEDAGYGSIRA